MEKFIFLATIRDKLTAMNLPKSSVDKHVGIFEKCLKGKSADEIDKVINSAGGVDGVVKSIYNLEIAKQKAAKENQEKTEQPKPSEEKVVPTTVIPEVSEEDEPLTLDSFDDEPSNDNVSDEMTIEIQKSPEIEQHILEAEQITSELEKTTINNLVTQNEEDVDLDISEYDFEKLFEEKLTPPEKWVRSLKEKMSSDVYKWTLPVAVLAVILIFGFVIMLYPIVIVTSIFASVAYLGILVAGILTAIVPIGFGLYMCFKNIPVALYELSLGIISAGVTMLSCIILYNYTKRLVPLLFKLLKKLFKLCVKITKYYFTNDKKEEK